MMRKWYALMPMLLASVIFAGCSSDTDDSDDGGGVEDAAPAESEESASAEEAEEMVAEESSSHDHGDASHTHGDEGHTHAAAEVSALGAIMASLDGSNAIEVACASCIYGMDGIEDCVLAAMVNDKPLLVTGIEFDTHGAGLCKDTGTARTAKIVGKVHENGIEATKVEMTD